ncbi:MAG: alpha-ketoglutarate-dependent dioxygenase AlkB [Deltaproteobacteria bacterium]|nr:MAG: alpha-ketoglutarate-dependent dioxygenase AlkB [Deltaproteobacteria bacterium]
MPRLFVPLVVVNPKKKQTASKEAPLGEDQLNLPRPVEPTESYLNHRLLLYRSVFPLEKARDLFSQLEKETQWLHPSYENSDGRVVHLPRLTANYGDRSYNYSGLTFQPQPWTPLLSELRHLAEDLTGASFNALILQYYRDGSDGVGWHSDDDPCVAPTTTIVSMSFGETRRFEFRHKENHDERLGLDIHGGDIVVMQGDLQKHYKHRVPKEKGKGGRINLTFRDVIEELGESASDSI